LEQLVWDSGLDHLKRDVATVVHQLRTDLDRFFLEAGQRAIF
jgi:hypothetical protein